MLDFSIKCTGSGEKQFDSSSRIYGESSSLAEPPERQKPSDLLRDLTKHSTVDSWIPRRN